MRGTTHCCPCRARSCVPWTPNFPTNCYCDAADSTHITAKALAEKVVSSGAPVPDMVAVWPPNTSKDACVNANEEYGCLNGFPYLFAVSVGWLCSCHIRHV